MYTSTRSFLARAAAGAMLAAVLVASAGCEVRRETTPPTTPAASDAEHVRQDTALATQALKIGATACVNLLPATDPLAPILTAIAAHADAHLTMLGGVWQPQANPSVDPQAIVPPAPTCSVPSLLTLLLDDAADAAAAAIGADAAGATMWLTIASSRYLDAADLASAVGTDISAQLPAFPANWTISLSGMGSDGTLLIKAEDATGYAYEFAASRSASEVRAPLVDEANVHRTRADQMAAANSDPRLGSYDVPEQVLDPAQVSPWLVSLEGDLAVRYAGAVPLTIPGDRRGVIDAAIAQMLRAHAVGFDIDGSFPLASPPVQN